MAGDNTSQQKEEFLRPHFTQWLAQYEITPAASGPGFVDQHGSPAWPAHVVTELDGQTYVSALDEFETSGPREVLESGIFRGFVSQAIDIPKGSQGAPRLSLEDGTVYLVRAQNTDPGEDRHIINVVFTQECPDRTPKGEPSAV
ncbi:hypothetical protein ABIA52_000034 [Paenarthrobacter histidinolovorans]|uniref:Uncharacterized protein n=1 Tax=Paenarthrobacter histidinolovorans TaxID=43664 RepID=A0ABW8N3B2_9MICC